MHRGLEFSRTRCRRLCRLNRRRRRQWPPHLFRHHRNDNADVPNWREVVREQSGVPRAAACAARVPPGRSVAKCTARPGTARASAATPKSGSQKRRRSRSGSGHASACLRSVACGSTWSSRRSGTLWPRGTRSPSRGSSRLRRRVGRRERGETPGRGRSVRSLHRRRCRSRRGKRFGTGCARDSVSGPEGLCDGPGFLLVCRHGRSVTRGPTAKGEGGPGWTASS